MYVYIYIFNTGNSGLILRLERQGSSHSHRTKHGISPLLSMGLEGLAVASLSGIQPQHTWLPVTTQLLLAGSLRCRLSLEPLPPRHVCCCTV